MELEILEGGGGRGREGRGGGEGGGDEEGGGEGVVGIANKDWSAPI